MTVDALAFGALAVQSLRQPRVACARLLALGVPMNARWMLVAFIAAASTLLVNIELRFEPPALQAMLAPVIDRPIVAALTQAVFLTLVAALIHRAGQAAGGQGGFADALLIVGWLQSLLLVVSAAQVVLLLVLPPMADLVGLVGVVAVLWMLVSFVAELHGFSSLPKVALGIVATALLTALALSTLLAPFLATAPSGG